MKAKLLAIAFLALIFLAGCAKNGFSGDKNADIAYCGNTQTMKLLTARNQCFHNLAILWTDQNLCGLQYIQREKLSTTSIPLTIMDDAVTKNIRNDCYYEIAKKLAKQGASAQAIASCGNIPGVTNLATTETGNMEVRDDCFYEIAIILHDASICEYISPDATKEGQYVPPAPPPPGFTPPPGYVPPTGTIEEVRFIDLCKSQII
ncbi:Uncharacterised protein [Candidatus Burarchaeum australiense]|nr:Uncharacterised protein [Candidatus Burarchaeum australiense]